MFKLSLVRRMQPGMFRLRSILEDNQLFTNARDLGREKSQNNGSRLRDSAIQPVNAAGNT
jgi:hypothetical protein